MYARVTFVTHHWPSISPWNIWQLPFHLWVAYARQADAELAEIRKANEQARRAGR